MSLFQAYAVASDEQFVRYIESKYDLYTEGKLVDPDTIMRVALTRYEIAQDQKKWKAPQKKNKVVAMVAKEKMSMKPKQAEEEDDAAPTPMSAA
jgi:hypothetical protein